MPAQQLARQLVMSQDAEVLFAGNGLEKSPFFEREEFFYEEVSSSSIRKGLGLFTMGWRILKGIGQSLLIVHRYQPDVVVGFGSFHSFPMLVAAWIRRKPLVLFEANCLLGKVNRLFAKKAKLVVGQFPLQNMAKYVSVPFLPWAEKKEKINPDTAKKNIGLQEEELTILVFGGSQGAVFLNAFAIDLAKELKKKEISFQFIHLTGSQEGEEQRVKSFYEQEKIPHVVKSFQKEMHLVFSMADFAITRSGASTLAEMLHYQVPAILIPFPHSADGHQEKNARFFQEMGGGLMVQQKEADPERMAMIISEMITDKKKKITDMKNRISEYYFQESQKRCKEISQLVMEIAGE